MKKAALKPAKQPAKRAEAGVAAFPIVGVGASAGGLEAFTELLTALPLDTGMAFVLIQHLEAEHESMLTELLSNVTSMPVTEVRKKTLVEPNHVYVIPANADLSLAGGELRVSNRKAPPDATCRSIISSAAWLTLTGIWPLGWFCPEPLRTARWA